jgi:uncharacterized protein YcfL
MKPSTLVGITATLFLLQGCSFNMPFSSSNQTAVMDDSTYDDAYGSESNVTRSHQARNEDEVPVQMTSKDSNMQAVAPVAKNPNKKNSEQNVLLPISSGDLE